jgi:hypothetical protein
MPARHQEHLLKFKGLFSLLRIQNWGNGFLNRVSGVRISPGPPTLCISSAEASRLAMMKATRPPGARARTFACLFNVLRERLVEVAPTSQEEQRPDHREYWWIRQSKAPPEDSSGGKQGQRENGPREAAIPGEPASHRLEQAHQEKYPDQWDRGGQSVVLEGSSTQGGKAKQVRDIACGQQTLDGDQAAQPQDRPQRSTAGPRRRGA